MVNWFLDRQNVWAIDRAHREQENQEAKLHNKQNMWDIDRAHREKDNQEANLRQNSGLVSALEILLSIQRTAIFDSTHQYIM
jgi:hypothetical protein